MHGYYFVSMWTWAWVSEHELEKYFGHISSLLKKYFLTNSLNVDIIYFDRFIYFTMSSTFPHGNVNVVMSTWLLSQQPNGKPMIQHKFHFWKCTHHLMVILNFTISSHHFCIDRFGVVKVVRCLWFVLNEKIEWERVVLTNYVIMSP